MCRRVETCFKIENMPKRSADGSAAAAGAYAVDARLIFGSLGGHCADVWETFLLQIFRKGDASIGLPFFFGVNERVRRGGGGAHTAVRRVPLIVHRRRKRRPEIQQRAQRPPNTPRRLTTK